jgi:hypothetical protein
MAPKYCVRQKRVSLPQNHLWRQITVDSYKEGIVQCRYFPSVSWIGQLRDDDRTRLTQKGRKEAQEEPGDDETVEVLRQALHDSERDTGDEAKKDRAFPTKSIKNVGCDKQCDDLASRVDGVHGTQKCSLRVVEETTPLGKSLKTVHHGAFSTLSLAVQCPKKVPDKLRLTIESHRGSREQGHQER